MCERARTCDAHVRERPLHNPRLLQHSPLSFTSISTTAAAAAAALLLVLLLPLLLPLLLLLLLCLLLLLHPLHLRCSRVLRRQPPQKLLISQAALVNVVEVAPGLQHRNRGNHISELVDWVCGKAQDNAQDSSPTSHLSSATPT